LHDLNIYKRKRL